MLDYMKITFGQKYKIAYIYLTNKTVEITNTFTSKSTMVNLDFNNSLLYGIELLGGTDLLENAIKMRIISVELEEDYIVISLNKNNGNKFEIDSFDNAFKLDLV